MSTIVGVTEPFQVILTLALLSWANNNEMCFFFFFSGRLCICCMRLVLVSPPVFYYYCWYFTALSPHSGSSIPLLSIFSSLLRSSFPLRVSTTVLQTVLTSAQKMTALLSSWRWGLAVPVHARANTAAITASVVQTALNRPKRKHSTSLMVLHRAPQQLSVIPQDVQWRAAALKRLLLRRK